MTVKHSIGIAAVAAVALSFAAEARTPVYVNCEMSDYTGHDGSTPEKAYERIQTAIDNVESGGTVIVAPGVYGEKQGYGRNTSHWWWTSRVLIKKSLHLKSSEGARKTFIVGKHNPTPGSGGFGSHTAGVDDCCRCVCVEASAGTEVVVEGFTLCDGATCDYANPSGRGGCILSSKNGGADGARTFVVDCVISNCIGAVSEISTGADFIRCRFEHNYFVRAKSEYYDPYFYESGEAPCFFNCLFWQNGTRDYASGNVTNGTPTVYFTPKGKFAHCTFADNDARFWNHSTTYWYNNLVSSTRIPTDDGAQRVDTIYDSTADAKRYLMSPATGDVRIRSTSGLAATSDASYFNDSETFPFPTTFAVERNVDLYGTPVPTEGLVYPGASQTLATPAGGCLVAGEANVNLDGTRHYHYEATYRYFETYPQAVRVFANLSFGQRMRKYTFSNVPTYEQTHRYPMADDSIWVMPPPEGVQKIWFDALSHVLYADPNTTDETADQDGSEAHPFKTLQQAMDRTTELGWDGSVVLAKPGVYDEGGVQTAHSASPVRARVKVANNSRIVALEGPEKTFIVGAPDPATGGNGADATMLLVCSGWAQVQGFTLTGGYTGPADVLYANWGTVFSWGTDVHISDCIISNNFGAARVLAPAHYERCLITRNTGAGGLSYGGKYDTCVIADNTVTGDGVLFGAANDYPLSFVGSTVIGDGTHPFFSNSYDKYRRVNTIFDNAAGTAYAAGVTAGSVYNGFQTVEAGAGYLVADPQLCGKSLDAAHPFAFYSRSPAWTCAVAPADDPNGISWYRAPLDIAGNVRRYDAAGRPVCGAVQADPVTGGIYVAAERGMDVVSGAYGYNDVQAGESVTVTLKGGATRPVAGFVVNGVTNLLTDASATELTVTKQEGVDTAVTLAYSADNSWYVDAENGSDDSFGYNPAFAFKTLTAALSNSALAAGDTVMALPGRYDAGDAFHTSGVKVRSRAVVPAGVTLKSRDGAATTFIVGAPSDAEHQDADLLPEGNRYKNVSAGMGPNAVRCAYVPSGATLDGFTLTNGYTRACNDAGGEVHAAADTSGAGALGYGTVRNCVVTGCRGFRGAGAYYATCVNCLFEGNVANYGGGATSDAKQYGCLSRNNTSYYASVYDGFFFWDATEGCTALDGMSDGRTSVAVMRNCLVRAAMGHAGSGNAKSNFVNCVIVNDRGGDQVNSWRQAILDGAGNRLVPSADAAVDADGRPVIGSNVGIDTADETIVTHVGETDLSGVQRVYNARRDVGALESDWRPVYAADIRRNQLTVETASPGVTESDAKGVLLPDAAELTGTLSARDAAEYRFEAKVPAGGTLTLTFNGEAVEPVAGEDGRMQYVVYAAAGDNELAFAYAGEGSAEILRSHKNSGMYLFVR